MDANFASLKTAMDANFAGIDVDEGAIADEVVIHMDANSTDLDAIKIKTDNLPADPADDSDIDDVTLMVLRGPGRRSL